MCASYEPYGGRNSRTAWRLMRVMRSAAGEDLLCWSATVATPAGAWFSVCAAEREAGLDLAAHEVGVLGDRRPTRKNVAGTALA